MNDKLYHAAKIFESLIPFEYVLTAAKKGKTFNITIHFEKEHFHHLVGLGKLTDIPNMKSRNRARIFDDILAKRITYETLSHSAFIHLVDEKLAYFSEIEDLLGQKIILKFDRYKTPNQSRINAKMLSFKPHEDGGYIHLFFNTNGKEADFLVPCSYFHDKTDTYIRGQERFSVIDIKKQAKSPSPKPSIKMQLLAAKEERQQLSNHTSKNRDLER